MDPQEIIDAHDRLERRLRGAFDDRKLLSIHEAGHAVIAEHFKMDVVLVQAIAPNKSFTQIRDRRPTKETLLEDVTMALGGYYAAFKETEDDAMARVHCGIDNQFLFELFTAFSVSPEEQQELMSRGQALSKELVERYWLAVKKIADEVFEYVQISGARAREILSQMPSS